MYADQTFDMYLTAADFQGSYALSGDTIWLHYSGAAPDASNLPPAFLIDRSNGTISNLVVEHDSLIPDGRYWMQITEDHLGE